MEKLIRTTEEAIDCLKKNKPTSGYIMLQESVVMAIEALENQKWHSGDEEPKEGSYIVAWLPVGMDSKADTPHYYAIWDYENESWNIDVPTMYEGIEINIIAWMPIPKPYIIG